VLLRKKVRNFIFLVITSVFFLSEKCGGLRKSSSFKFSFAHFLGFEKPLQVPSSILPFSGSWGVTLDKNMNLGEVAVVNDATATGF